MSQAVSEGESDRESAAAAEAPKTKSGETEIVATGQEAKASDESADDSLEAILLQATTALLQEPGGAKALGSKTLMGTGTDGWQLPGLRNDDGEASLESSSSAQVTPVADNDGAKTPAIVEAKLASAHLDDDAGPTSSLLDEVANALSAQASEYRDRARGRLPGMPATVTTAASDTARTLGPGAAEFEDPEEDKTGLTPAIISVVDEVDFAIETDLQSGVETRADAGGGEGGAVVAAAFQAAPEPEAAEAVVQVASGTGEGQGDLAAQATSAEATAAEASTIQSTVDPETQLKSELKTDPRIDLQIALGLGAKAEPGDDAEADARLVVGDSHPSPLGVPSLTDAPNLSASESKPTKVPPAPGLPIAPAAVTVGPPPGAPARPSTPSSGLPLSPSGRTRLPSSSSGMSVLNLPAPSVSPGRVTLPPGTMSPFATSGVPSTDLTATSPSTPISLEASRRISEAAATRPARGGSGRVTRSGASRNTQPVLHPAPASLPAILNAHVRLATVSLAGLIAVTFAGGLLVGMLVWRGQATHIEAMAPAHQETPGATPAPAAVTVAPAAAPSPAVVPVVGSASPPATTEATANSPVPGEAAPSAAPSTTAAAAAVSAAIANGSMPGQPNARKEPSKEAPTVASSTSPGSETTAMAEPATAKKHVAAARPARARRTATPDGETDGTATAATAGAAIARPGAVKPPPFHPAAFHPPASGSGVVLAGGATPSGKAAVPGAAAAKAASGATASAAKAAPATASAAPKPAPSIAAAPAKTVASNSTAKTAAKAKAKTAWKDPFAD